MPQITDGKIVKTADELDVVEFLSGNSPEDISTWFVQEFSNLSVAQVNRLKKLVKLVMIIAKRVLTELQE